MYTVKFRGEKFIGHYTVDIENVQEMWLLYTSYDDYMAKKVYLKLGECGIKYLYDINPWDTEIEFVNVNTNNLHLKPGEREWLGMTRKEFTQRKKYQKKSKRLFRKMLGFSRRKKRITSDQVHEIFRNTRVSEEVDKVSDIFSNMKM
jgi:hypothetical protein